ncbi:MAG: endonuclease/exonuclease/phosphatase family protein [Acidobacteriota bacterium]
MVQLPETPRPAMPDPSLALPRRLGPAAEIGHKPDGALRLFTLNLAHGRRLMPHQTLVPRSRVESHLAEVAETIAVLAPDVAAFQEADGPSAWSGNFDHVAALAEGSGLRWHFRGEHNPFGVGRYDLAAGTALTSLLPLEVTWSQRFGVSWRDTKGFVVATVMPPAWGFEIDVVSVHLDFLLPRVRRRQIRAMADVLVARRRPCIVLGDLNCGFVGEPATMRLLIQALDLHTVKPLEGEPTYPAYRPKRRLDWILASSRLRFSSYLTIPDQLSDHLAVLADVVPA